jgi:epoxyqueuosine reductase
MFRHSPVRRARYNGFLRNVIVAMGNSGSERCRPILAKLSESHEAPIAEHARWALQQIP